jgi:hypothetical protein
MSFITRKSPATRRVFKVLIATGMIAGCGEADSRKGLSGNVTFKGELMPSGSIQFESVAGQSPAFSTGAMIKDGSFVVPAGKSGLPAGQYRVMINAASTPFLVPGPPGSQPVMETKELVPAAYNTDSEVTIEVSNEGENEFTFDIP